MKILAGITLYNPDINRLKENINAIYKQVDKLIFINNDSKNRTQIEKMLNDLIVSNKISNSLFEIIDNKKNEGVAYALNEMLDYASENGYDWFLTLDQDSVSKPELIEKYKKYISQKDVAMMTCIIKDRNFVAENKMDDEYTYVNRCITSAALNNTKIIKELGGFDNELFIDSVDFDICATIIENGYKILKVNYEGILHEVGHTKTVKIFGKTEYIYNHSPFRTYYVIRNAIIMNYKHESLNTLKNKLRVIKREIIIVLFQKNKIENIKAIRRARRDAKKIVKQYRKL